MKLGKFIIDGLSLIFEEHGTGVLKKLNMETNLITLFDAFCAEERSFSPSISGLFINNNVLHHAWGGKLRRYLLNHIRPDGSVTRFSKAYLCRPRAILLSDTDEESLTHPSEFMPFCEYQGSFYSADTFTLTRLSKQGKCESVNLFFSVVCLLGSKDKLIAACDKGALYSIDPSNFFLPSIHRLASPQFNRPRQILEHMSIVYVLDSNGIWMLGKKPKLFRLPHVVHFALCSKNDTTEIVCSEFNSVFRIKICD